MAGYFVRRKDIPFSQVSNEALRDPQLPLRAKGLYCVIQSYISIPGFTLYKSHLRQIAQLGPKAFNNDWNELKKNGYLKQARVRTESGFAYEYELLDRPDLDTPATVNIGLNGRVVSTGNGKNEPSSVGDGSNSGMENEPIPVEDGSNLNTEVEPIPLGTRFAANLVRDGGCINNTYINNTYEKIDRLMDTAEEKENQISCKRQAVENQRFAIIQEMRDYLNTYRKLPDYIWASRMRCTEAIRLLTHYYYYAVEDKHEPYHSYSNNPVEQEAYKLFNRSLIQMCLAKKMSFNGEVVKAADVIDKLNDHIEFDEETEGNDAFGLSTFMDAVIDTYCHAEIATTMKSRQAYMQVCIWSQLCSPAQEQKTTLVPAGASTDQMDTQQLDSEFAARKDVRAYLIENHELPYDILDSEIQCTAAIHLLTHYEHTYSNNRLTQATFELFNYSLIQMCLSQEPLKPCGAHVTSAKVLEQLNKCIDFSDDPHYPVDLDVMRDVIDDYRQAEMKQAERQQTIKNKIMYMQSCIWSRLVTHRVSDGIIQEQIENWN